MRLDGASPTNIMSTGAASPVSLDAAVAAAAQPPPPPVMADYQEPPDTKEGIEELCPVCGDKVSGYHYGLLTCESCKGFFKRTVQNKKVYTCVAERNCHIDKSQRKRCPFCRFQKCLDVGMKLEAVRADRMRGGRNKFGPMYKRDRARKLQLLRQKQMQQHTRPQCQLNPEVAGAGVGGNGAAGGGGGGGGGGPLTATTMASTLVYVSGGGPGNPMYATGGAQGGIKQEIQIPQLSSSTASPDSSSSPNNPLVLSSTHMANPSPNTLHSPPADPHHKLATAWVPPHTPGTPTSSTPSPHSPKGGFHYPEGTGAAGIPQHVGNGGGPGKIPALIREFQQSSQDDKEWQSQLFGLLQSQTYNQCEVDLFELMCKVLDQNLFAQVDWARNSLFFKDLKVDDQMKLLQYSWSDMLILDHIHHRLHHNLPDETTLPNGQKFDLLTLAVLGLPNLVDQFNELSAKMQELKLDSVDYICLKFMLLLNPEVRGLVNRKHIHEAHEQVKQALLDYAMNSYTQVQDKFAKMMQLLPEVHMLSLRGEEYLYYKHLNGSAPTQTLLMEMLHAKKK